MDRLLSLFFLLTFTIGKILETNTFRTLIENSDNGTQIFLLIIKIANE